MKRKTWVRCRLVQIKPSENEAGEAFSVYGSAHLNLYLSFVYLNKVNADIAAFLS